MLDSNVLQALTDVKHPFHATALRLFEAAQRESNEILLCPAVYAEAHSFPMFRADVYNAFFADAGIEIDWIIPERAWSLAGLAQAAHHERRRKAGVSAQRKLMADFVIGAHALARDATLLSFDTGYRALFPLLELRSA